MALFATGCSKKEEPTAVEVDVQAAAVQQTSITQHITADAVLTPLAEAAISPKVTAPVKKFYVHRGAKSKREMWQSRRILPMPISISQSTPFPQRAF